jgi:hypothetical protein
MNLIIKILGVPLLLILPLFGCKMEPITILPKDITGQWEWIYTYKIYVLSDSNPLIPKNNGIHELPLFNTNKTWSNTQNSI